MPSSRNFGTTLVVIYIFLEVQGSHRGTIFLDSHFTFIFRTKANDKIILQFSSSCSQSSHIFAWQ